MHKYSPRAGGPAYQMEASNDELMRRAHADADAHLNWAIMAIDKRLGKDYAAKHPELIVGYMRTAATDLGSFFMARAIESVTMAIRELPEPLRSDHPLQGETFDGLSASLRAIAGALGSKDEEVMTEPEMIDVVAECEDCWCRFLISAPVSSEGVCLNCQANRDVERPLTFTKWSEAND